MDPLQKKHVLVIGLGDRGRSACELLIGRGARVTAVDVADTAELRKGVERLRQLGVMVALGATDLPDGAFDLAVLSPAVARRDTLVQQVLQKHIHLISELELGYQESKCLSLAVAGTNGKSTTAALIQHILTASHRKTLLAGDWRRPLCSFVDQTKDLDCLVLQVNAFQLEQTEFFRPVVAVLTNLAPDHLDRYATPAEYVAAHAGLFRNQQAFDWAVVQSEALSRVRAAGIPIPAKLITFSATDPSAELHVDRGLLISRLPDWSGPLLDMDSSPTSRTPQQRKYYGGFGGGSRTSDSSGRDGGKRKILLGRAPPF